VKKIPKHWTWRKEEAKNQVRQTLQKGKATWGDLAKKVTSPVTLSKALKELMNTGEVTTEVDSKDRRITWYKAIPEKVDIHIKRYKAQKFLENLKNPTSKEETKTIKNYEVTISYFFEGGDKEKLEKIEPKAFDVVTDALDIVLSVSKATKVALVVTAEEEKHG
jgi:DNA-binding HxlR family transcriptional regulator